MFQNRSTAVYLHSTFIPILNECFCLVCSTSPLLHAFVASRHGKIVANVAKFSALFHEQTAVSLSSSELNIPTVLNYRVPEK